MPTINAAALPSWWSLKNKLPIGLTARPLQSGDFERGYLECLGQLTVVGPVSRQQFLERLEYMKRNEDTYMPIVILDSQDRVVACGTLVLERKFIHECGILAHIEDIVVDSSQRGMGLGRVLIEQLKYLAFKHGAYKITLDCDEKNEQFYSKGEFETKGLQMCIYYKDDSMAESTAVDG